MTTSRTPGAVSADVGFKILGPVEIVHGDDSVPVPPGRQQIILSALLLEANRVVSMDYLIDAVWDERPPTTARSQIQICVSQLRQLFSKLGVECPIVTRPPGYVLHVAEGRLDMHAFADLVAQADATAAQGRLAEAAELLRQALALWRGRALGGDPSPLLHSKAVRLDEDRLNATETCIDLELRLGRHRQLVGELGALVEEHPLRERLRGLFMLALYRSGRPADALEVYRAGRRLLVDELGMEPGEELRQLESAILGEDQSLRLDRPEPAPAATAAATTPVPVVAPRQLPADIVDFTGREALVDDAEAVLRAGGPDRAVPVVVIAGKAGIGKTVLAIHVAHRLGSDVFPDGQLYCSMAGTHAQPIAVGDVLSRFLRALGVPGASIPDEVDERADMYRSMLANKRVLVVLDGVAAESHVTPLLPGSGTCAVLVTSRTRLTGISGARLLDVDVMQPRQALQMLRNAIGEQRVAKEPAAAEALVRLVGGLPLALRIVAARLAARPHWLLASMLGRLADERRRLDELTHGDMMVRASLFLTYDGLQPRVAQLFRLLSVVMGESVPIWVAAALLDDDPLDSAGVLELLVDTQMLDVRGLDIDGEPRYAFHNIIWLFARERLAESGESTLPALTRVLGGWLALAETAHRAVYGGDFAVLRGKSPRWQPPPEVRDRAVADPHGWLDAERVNLCAAIDQAAGAGLHEQAWELAIYLVTLFETFSYFDDWQATHERALEAVRAAGNRRGEAALLCSLGTLNVTRRRLATAPSVLQPALELFTEFGDQHGEAMVLRNLALLYDNQGESERALDAYERALEGFRRAGDLVSQAYVLTQLAQLDFGTGRPDCAMDRLNEAMEICREISSPRMEAQVMYRLGQAMHQQRRHEEAQLVMTTVLDMARRNRDALGESYALHTLGVIAGALRRPAESERLLRTSLEVKERIHDSTGTAKVYLDLARLLADRGEPAQAVELAQRALHTFTEHRMAHWQERARALLDSLTSAG